MNIEASKKITPKDLQYLSMAIMCIALPTSIFLISIAQFGIALAWLWQGNYKNSWSKFIKNKTATSLSIIFLIHVFGLFYSSNWIYAFNDLRIKLPILVLPLLLAGFDELTEKKTIQLIWLFILSTLVSTLISTYILLGLSQIEVRDVRQSSVLISHIRLSLMICISIYFCGYSLIKSQYSLIKKIFISSILIWFIVFLFIIESGTGVFILIFIFTILLIYSLLKNISKLITSVSIVIIIGVAFFTFFQIKVLYSEFRYIHHIDFNKLDKKTILGNNYEHHLEDNSTENGYHVGLYQNWEECIKSWKYKSKIDPSGQDLRGQDLKYTMFRYLTSKGLRKDSMGVSLLTEADVSNIENGFTNYKFSKNSFKKRINDLFYEYENFSNKGSANGHSVYMRIEFWNTAFHIIKNNFFVGVGTGDVNDAFISQYENDHSKLYERYRLRSHNQFISFTVAFGIVGLIAFIFLLVQIYKNNLGKYHFQIFFIVLLLSFINEDTLETSTGAVLFSYMTCLLSFNTFSEDNK